LATNDILILKGFVAVHVSWFIQAIRMEARLWAAIVKGGAAIEVGVLCLTDVTSRMSSPMPSDIHGVHAGDNYGILGRDIGKCCGVCPSLQPQHSSS
jgi:hypothetical protein